MEHTCQYHGDSVQIFTHWSKNEGGTGCAYVINNISEGFKLAN